jgi:2-methylcitrate dehydratase PrpD
VLGSGTGLAQRLVPAIAQFSAGGHASIAGRPERASAPDAALVNGAFAQALDYDDCSDVAALHSSAPCASALLAVAEWRASTGGDLLAAFVVASEVTLRIGRAISRDLMGQGMHPTGVIGGVGAAAGIARLLRLDAERAAWAIALAATQAPAALGRVFGSPAKPLHAGVAAQGGVVAGLLAENGFTSSDRILDADRGFTGALVRDPGALAGDVATLGEEWLLPGIQFRPYDCCGGHHATIEAAIALRDGYAIEPDAIGAVELHLSEETIRGAAIPRPRTPDAARLSAQYTVGTALLRGRLVSGDFAPAAIDRADIQTLLPRMTVTARHPRASQGGLMVTLRDGRRFEHQVAQARGSAGNPMPDGDLRSKFVANADWRLGSERTAAIQRLLDRFEDVTDAGELMRLASCP